MVEKGEREILREAEDQTGKERFTSLQPTYEDTVPPESDDDWAYED